MKFLETTKFQWKRKNLNVCSCGRLKKEHELTLAQEAKYQMDILLEIDKLQKQFQEEDKVGFPEEQKKGIEQARQILIDILTKKMICKEFSKREETHTVQGAVRPIELYEYVFPEECLDEVLTFLGHAEGAKNDLGGWKGKLAGDAIRKMLGYEKIPVVKPTKSPTANWVPHNLSYGVNVLGIKRDKRQEWVDEGYEQEML